MQKWGLLIKGQIGETPFCDSSCWVALEGFCFNFVPRNAKRGSYLRIREKGKEGYWDRWREIQRGRETQRERGRESEINKRRNHRRVCHFKSSNLHRSSGWTASEPLTHLQKLLLPKLTKYLSHFLFLLCYLVIRCIIH